MRCTIWLFLFFICDLCLILAFKTKTCDLNFNQRFACRHVASYANEELCTSFGCCWSNEENWGGSKCYHSNPSLFSYKVVNVSEEDNDIILHLQPSNNNISIFAVPLHNLQIRITPLSLDTVTVTIEVDKLNGRAETSRNNSMLPLYIVEYSSLGDELVLKIKRRSTGTVLLHLEYAGLIVNEKYSEITFVIPTTNVYGLGQTNRMSLKLNFNWNSWTLLSKYPDYMKDTSFQGVHPVYMGIESTGDAHGVFISNSSPLEVNLSPIPSITFRTLGGRFQFNVFLGPSPNEVVAQFSQIVGKPALPPYWSLGFHTCRATGNLSRAEAVVAEMRQEQIPHESDCGDLEYMGSIMFNIDSRHFSNFTLFIQDLHDNEQKLLLFHDPQIYRGIPSSLNDYYPFEDGLHKNVFLKTTNGELYEGLFWRNFPVVYPDFEHPNTTFPWLEKHYKQFYQRIPFDGLLLDMNTPLDLRNRTVTACPIENGQNESNIWDYPTVAFASVGEHLAENTICMNTVGFNGIKHFEIHNKYGFLHSRAIHKIAKRINIQKRPLILSLSTFSGSGQYAGAWGGEYIASWNFLKMSVLKMLEFSLYNIPLNGVPICGVWKKPTEDLCLKWFQTGSLYPFALNYYGYKQMPRDPLSFSDSFKMATKDLLLKRYSLLPYFYTLFYQSHKTGFPVIRPMFFEFSNDPRTFNIDEQFLWGPALLVTPNLKNDNPSYISAYFPQGRWYDLYTGQSVSISGDYLELTGEFPVLHIRGGYIIVTQTPNTTITLSRQNSFTIYAALDSNHKATGSLFVDDGISIDGFSALITFTLQEKSLQIVKNNSEEAWPEQLSSVVEKIIIYGMTTNAVTVSVDNDVMNSELYDYNQSTGVFILRKPLSLTSNHTIEWN